MAGNRVRKNKRRSPISRLFRSSNFLLIISFVIAIIVWITMSLSDTHEATSTISNIPIQINLSDTAVENGLEIFSGNDQTASVTVEGNRVSLGSISSDDIVVSAQTAGTIQTSGTWTLSLSARKNNPSDNFDIVSTVSPSVITVFVDQMREAEFNIENKIKYKVSDGYHASASLSTDKITVKGPQTEIDKIASVAIEGKVGDTLTEDTSIESAVKLYDKSGEELSSSMITLSDYTVTANFSVLPEKEVPIAIAFKNKPNGLNVDSFTTMATKKILVAAPKDVLDKLKSISTEEVDFNTLSNKAVTLDLQLQMPEKTLNLSEKETVRVKIDLHSFSSKNFEITNDNLTVSGLNSSYTCSITTDSLVVNIKGAKSQLKKIKASNIMCDIDASDIEGTTGSITLPVKISLVGINSCWVYGDYKVNLYVTNNE